MTTNIPQKQFDYNGYLLLLISLGPILDLLFSLSAFSRLPAPMDLVLVIELGCFAIYMVCFILFMSKQFWSKWVVFAIYIVWTLLAMGAFSLSGSSTEANIMLLFELLIRFSILIYMINSDKWIMKYKQEHRKILKNKN